MKTISVHCPKCQTANTAATPATEGSHVMCRRCSHVFKVVPKLKAAALDAPPRAVPVSEAHANLAAMLQEMTHKQTNATNTPVQTASQPPADILTMPGSSNMPARSPTSGAAVTEVIPTSANTSVDMHIGNLVFTLLPPKESVDHATLPLLQDTQKQAEHLAQQQHTLAQEQRKLTHEFNWTLASLVALTVLILQLFYLMAVP